MTPSKKENIGKIETETKSKPAKPELVKTTADVGDAVNQTSEFLNKNLGVLFTDNLKVEILGWLILFIGMILTALIVFGPSMMAGISTMGTKGMVSSLLNAFSAQNIGALALGIIVFILTMIVYNTIESVKYNIIDGRSKGQSTGIISQATANAVPIITYAIAMLIILALVFALPVLMLLTKNPILILVSLALFLLATLVVIVILFLTQFAIWELLINRKSPIESIKASSALATKNILQTFLFDIVYVIIAGVSSVVISVFSWIVQLISMAISLVNPTLGTIVYLIFYVIASMLIGIVSSIILLSLAHTYWKNLQR